MTEAMPCPWCGGKPRYNGGAMWCFTEDCPGGGIQNQHPRAVAIEVWNDQRGVASAVADAYKDGCDVQYDAGVADERERCAMVVCIFCKNGVPFAGVSGRDKNYHLVPGIEKATPERCRAAAIREGESGV